MGGLSTNFNGAKSIFIWPGESLWFSLFSLKRHGWISEVYVGENITCALFVNAFVINPVSLFSHFSRVFPAPSRQSGMAN